MMFYSFIKKKKKVFFLLKCSYGIPIYSLFNYSGRLLQPDSPVTEEADLTRQEWHCLQQSANCLAVLSSHKLSVNNFI